MNLAAIRESLSFSMFGYQPNRKAAETWEREYRAGRWDYLDKLDTIGGLITIFGYCQYFSANSILDVGCGEGLLVNKLKALRYRDLVGIDGSSEAIGKAEKQLGDARTRFVVCDAEKFAPDSTFDMIIFNQCLYYMADPVSMLRRYAEFLSPSGRMIVSMYDCARNRALWSLILPFVDIEDSITTIQSSGRTVTKILTTKRTTA